MSVDVHPKIIFLYFDNHLNYLKAKNLHLFCVAGSIRYVSSKIRGHSSNYFRKKKAMEVAEHILEVSSKLGSI